MWSCFTLLTARACDSKEIPVRWDHAEGSKVNVASDSYKMLSEVGRIRQQARRGVYDRAIKGVHDTTGR